MSGNDGSFSITLTPGTTQLEITAVGFGTRRINIADVKDGEILLTTTSQDLGEVVVTALGIKREKRA